ncbi:MAG: hypothetical protein AB7F50_00680 [Fimbriimonadaceae bacterium]
MLTAVTVWLAGNLVACGSGWIATARNRVDGPVMAQFDPKLGIVVAQASDTSQQRLFVHVGACTGCSALQLEPSKTLAPAGATVTVLYSGKECTAPEHLKALPEGWRGVCDQDGAVQSSLNLYFAPRWFEADREGKLVWLGKDAEDFPEGVKTGG